MVERKVYVHTCIHKYTHVYVHVHEIMFTAIMLPFWCIWDNQCNTTSKILNLSTPHNKET